MAKAEAVSGGWVVEPACTTWQGHAFRTEGDDLPSDKKLDQMDKKHMKECLVNKKLHLYKHKNNAWKIIVETLFSIHTTQQQQFVYYK